MKKIIILGSTGSVGTQTLNVIRKYPKQYKIIGLAVNKNTDLLAKQIKNFKPKHIAIADASASKKFAKKHKLSAFSGKNAIEHLASLKEADIIVNAITGAAGVSASWAAVNAGKKLALANKESLVAFGKSIAQKALKTGSIIFPIDSELSSVHQMLLQNKNKTVKTIYLTASGGPFRKYDKEKLKTVTVEKALDHPTWKMGPKITIDSATMVNKAFEITACHNFFHFPLSKIKALIHPISYVHALIEWQDKTVSAVVSPPNMEDAIAFAISEGKIKQPVLHKASLEEIKKLYPLEEFKKGKFEAYDTVLELVKKGGKYAEAIIKADDIVVGKFLKRKIKFINIAKELRKEVEKTLNIKH